MDNLLIYRSAENAVGIYDHAFWGLYQSEGLALAAKILIPILALASIVLVLIEKQTQKQSFGKWVIATSLLNFALITISLSELSEELFTQLRHALHFAEANSFSYNRFSKINGTLDFLPFFILSLLSKIGFPLIETAVALSVSGAILCLFALRKLWKQFEIKPWIINLLFVGICHFPPLLFNAGTGLTATLFSAAILWSLYFLFFSSKQGAGLLIGSLIPVIRFEGISITIFFWIFYAVKMFQARQVKKIAPTLRLVFLDGFSLFFPFILLSFFRWSTFGSPYPLTLKYLSSTKSIEFATLGLANLVSDLWSSFSVAALLVLVNCWTLARWSKRSQPVFTKRMFALSIAFFLFLLPYYLVGGDSLPSYLGRYPLPLTLILFALASEMAVRTFEEAQKAERTWLMAMGLGLLVSHLLIPSSGVAALKHFSGSGTALGTSALQQNSKLGFHLSNTTNPKETIAGSQVSALSFFAQRDALDLVGATNPELAGLPIAQKLRVRADLISLRKPSYLIPGNFNTSEINLKSSREDIQKFFLRLNAQQNFWMGYYFGGVSLLTKQKYQPVAVIFPNGFASLYYVSPEALPYHVALMERRGLKVDAIEENTTPLGKPVSEENKRRLSTSVPE